MTVKKKESHWPKTLAREKRGTEYRGGWGTVMGSWEAIRESDDKEWYLDPKKGHKNHTGMGDMIGGTRGGGDATQKKDGGPKKTTR